MRWPSPGAEATTRPSLHGMATDKNLLFKDTIKSCSRSTFKEPSCWGKCIHSEMKMAIPCNLLTATKL